MRLLAVLATILVTFVAVVNVNAVCSLAPCTCIVVPCTSAISPLVPGTRPARCPVPWPPFCPAPAAVVAAAAVFADDPPQAETATAAATATTVRAVVFVAVMRFMQDLLVSESVDGSEAGGAVGGIDPGGHADDKGDREGTHGGDREDRHGLVEEAWE